MNLDGIIVLQDPAEIPADPADIPPEALINIDVWAALQGVKKTTVEANRSRHNARRGTPQARAGDMPGEDTVLGRVPFWRMSTFREWQASKPGKGAGAGRPKGTGGKYSPRAPRTLQLPGSCPHCEETIRRKDLPEDAKTRSRRSLELPALCPHCRREIRGEDLMAKAST
ncbi:hypothetical protein [Actinomadura sp. WMMA1423]|uniref:hypothetical protein n=1 Tax=Actinomadura sp. WMMA1423 TaxID=2591108 RepID=UPI00114637D3|nr:hypothetical protein [Actinomadura sp. WMMA1423]